MNDKELISKIIDKIYQLDNRSVNIMEVCGTHTQSIAKYGIKELLPSNINLLSGPGCPVCVTHESFIDAAIRISRREDVILATFGDMLKVRGSKKSLQDLKGEGKNIVVIYSPLDTIVIARENPEKTVVFMGVGFETTSPVIARVIKMVKELEINNLYFLLSLKRMKPIVKKVFSDKSHNIQGMICPGHVAVITGSDYFKFISEKEGVSAAVCGFESLDIIGGIYLILDSVNKNEALFYNQYKRAVKPKGNIIAKSLLDEVFDINHDYWRGLGKVENSALVLNKDYRRYDALDKFNVILEYRDIKSLKCKCDEIILGKSIPYQCEFFNSVCNPNNPVGPCMVSSEGTCLIYYKYKRWS